jgi:hypothetical protein
MDSRYYAFMALDLARERSREASRHRLAALDRAGEPQVGRLRRVIARVAIAVARAADADAARTPVATQ